MIDLRVIKLREPGGAVKWVCHPEGICVGAADSNNVETIRVHLPEEWAAYTVRLTMRPYRKPAVALIVRDGDEVAVTGNMTCGRGGNGEIVFDAAGAEGEVTYTARGPYYTYAHGLAGGGDPGYTPDEYQQFVASVQEMAATAEDAAARAEEAAGNVADVSAEAEAAAAAAEAAVMAGENARGYAESASSAASRAEEAAVRAEEAAGSGSGGAMDITVDQTVIEGSENPVSGGAVKTYVDGVVGDRNGEAGTDGQDGKDGKSAYEIAVDNGFEGSEEEWLESLKGKDGASAYDIAVKNGFEGSEQEWLDSFGSVSELVTPISYADLKALVETSSLVSGMNYRITDYVTASTQENTQSAGHPFDIIVTALSENVLSGECYAALRDGDTYFSSSGIGSWKLWYTMDNDTTRFAWADAANGKGVIYRMIDENGNDCPYDFKNIRMRNPLDTADENYYYTFDSNGTDHSLAGSLCFNNVISKYMVTAQRINNIIFNANGAEVSSNFFDVQCYNNVFATAQRGNRFDRECYGNNFLGYNYLNTFATKFRNNTVGSECQSMQFGQGATSNVIGANTYYCQFGNYFRYNNTCKYMYYSGFGHNVQYCNFSESADVPERYMRYLTFENNVQYVNLYKSDKTTTKYMANIRLCSGLVGTSASRIMIEVSELDQNYTITYANNAEGQLVKYCDADGSDASVTVDSEMSDTSVNPAQNKAVKAYVDGKITYGTADLTAGTSALETGKLYFVYE